MLIYFGMRELTSFQKLSSCVSPLAASLLEMVLDDSLNTVLELVNNKENIQQDAAKSISRRSFSPKDSLLGDESFDLNKIPVVSFSDCF